MIKKTIQSFAFFALLQVLIFSCCTEDYNLYYESLYFTAEDAVDGDTTTVTSEDLILNFETLFDYVVASNFKELKKFSNTAYATSCDENYTLKEHVSEIIITANQDILGIVAGNSLNNKLSYKNPETLENEPIENVITILNDGNGYNYNRKDFVLNEAIAEGTTLAFTIKITMEENGRMLEASTETITIE
ncbi:hypothetical protein [Lacinutrix sp. MEBiC02595]